MAQRWTSSNGQGLAASTGAIAGPSRDSLDERRGADWDPDHVQAHANRLSANVSTLARRLSDQELTNRGSSSPKQQQGRSSQPNSGRGTPTRPVVTPRSSSRHQLSPTLNASQMGSVHDGHAYSEATTTAGGPGPDGSQATMSGSGQTSSHDAAPSRGEIQPSTQTAVGDPSSNSQSAAVSNSQHHVKERSANASRRSDQSCDACQKPMTGQFVRALGVVYHLDCFRCRDCKKVVAAKFFPATDEMSPSPVGSSGSHDAEKQQSPTGTGTGRLFPLCEVDYFRRLDLLCANCGGALRGSYITALGKKFHVEHFTCSICPTVFGPQDSYYEHDGRVFCHFHYSTRFAIRCTGCRTAILKQFVEINRNNQDEHWHPECYMIHKFWNIKLSPTGSTPRELVALEPTTVPEAPEPTNSGVAPVTSAGAMDAPSTDALETEASETPSSLKHKQKQMEEQVYRIWTVLSAFEESSAACISDMLRQVSNGKYLGGVQMAERFILHVEVLFAAVDDLEAAFRQEQAKGVSHIREARMLCKKIVNFFSLLSHTQETGAQRMGITQELLSLVTGLAHYLKILIRIALTGALRLERDFDNFAALSGFLDRLASLAQEDESPQTKATQVLRTSVTAPNGTPPRGTAKGYRSLPRSTSTSLSEGGESATDLCVACGQTVEEECARIGINLRWHTACVKCAQCKRLAQRDPASTKGRLEESSDDGKGPPPLPAQTFALDVVRRSQDPSLPHHAAYDLYCTECKSADARGGFEHVSRLEQYSYLLRVALNRLYALLKKRGVVPASPQPASIPAHQSLSGRAESDDAGDEETVYTEGGQDIRRKKSLNMDRKLSTKARVPHISTVVGSPSGQLPAVQKPVNSIDAHLHDSPIDRSRDASPSGRQTHFPLPNRGQTHQQQQSQQQQYQQPGGPLDEQQYVGTKQGPIVPIRPAFARHNTDVRIQDQGPLRQSSGDDRDRAMIADPEEHMTLADIPQLLQQEQAREQHRRLPSFDGRAIAELSVQEHLVIKHLAVLMLQQTPLKDVVPIDELIDSIDPRKNTFWGKLFKGGKEKKKVEKKGTFNIPLDVLVERNGADCTMGATSMVLRVPSFLDDILSAMRQMDVTAVGIFRKSGNIRRLKDLREALDRDPASVNFFDHNVINLADFLKQWLRAIPEPLFTFKLYRLFVMSQRVEPYAERLRCLHLLSVLLPKAHHDTMEVLFVFLRWIASFSHIDEETGSKMDFSNLATCLGPSILYGDKVATDEFEVANSAIEDLLVYQDVFWRVPFELEGVLQDRELLNLTSELTSREILKRCEKYAKRSRSGLHAYNAAIASAANGGIGFAQQDYDRTAGGHGYASNKTFAGAGDAPPSSSTIRSLGDPSYNGGNGGMGMPMRQNSQQQSPTQDSYHMVRSPVDGGEQSVPPWADARQRQHQQQQHQQHQLPRHPPGPPPPPPGTGSYRGGSGPPSGDQQQP